MSHTLKHRLSFYTKPNKFNELHHNAQKQALIKKEKNQDPKGIIFHYYTITTLPLAFFTELP